MIESIILIIFQPHHAKNYPGGGGLVISLATEGLLLNRIYTLYL